MKAKAHKQLSREELLQRIWIDPARCFGKPCIRGHRIWVSLILDLLASGTTERKILKEYPGLEPEDIQACIHFGLDEWGNFHLPQSHFRRQLPYDNDG
jgi:uncharacterized protein (DUF433 family)